MGDLLIQRLTALESARDKPQRQQFDVGPTPRVDPTSSGHVDLRVREAENRENGGLKLKELMSKNKTTPGKGILRRHQRFPKFV